MIAVSGSTVTINHGNVSDVPAGSSVTFTEDQYYLRNFTAQNATWLLITGNGTANSASTISHGGVIATNNYIFGHRYGIHVNGGSLLIGRLTNTGFDEVGTILQCDNHGTVYDLQIDNFLTFGLLATTSASPPTTLFVIDNPPPDSFGNSTARLSISSMTVGFSTGTLFDISGPNVSEVKISGCKLTRFANISAGQPYYALRINAPSARLMFTDNDVLPASGGNTGIQINSISYAAIVGNVFSSLQTPIDIETTGGKIALGGNMSRGTVGSSAIVGIGTANVEDYGNAWDQRPLNWNPIMPSYMSTAVNGISFRGDGGFGVSVDAVGASPDVTLNLVTSGAGSISMLTRGFSPQFVVQDDANTDIIFASGGGTGAPASINSRGSSGCGLALQNNGGGAIQLGSTGISGSSIVHKGAVADQSYTAPAGIGGGTYQVPNNTSDVQLTTGVGSIASMTVVIPTAPIDGQVLDLASVASISALSVQAGNGAGVAGSPTSLPANGCIRFKYLDGAINQWFHRAFN